MNWNIRCIAKKDSAIAVWHLCVLCMSSGDLGKIPAKFRAFSHKDEDCYAGLPGCSAKTKPAGGGGPAGFADIDWRLGRRRGRQSLPGDIGRRRCRPADEKDIGRVRAEQKRRIRMAPMRRVHGRHGLDGRIARIRAGKRGFRRMGLFGVAARHASGANNNARRGRRSGGRHKVDWQLGGGVLPIVSEERWEEECAAPNSICDAVSGDRILRRHAGRSIIPPSRLPVALRYAAPWFSGAGSFPIR